MAQHAANVTSIDAVAALRAALVEFEARIRDAIVQLTLEARRPIDWIEHDRTQYWPRQVRKASDALSEARLALQRCELTIDADHRRSCYDERKALAKSKQRLELAEAKVAAVRRWRLEIRKQVEAFEVESAKLSLYLDSELARGIATLDRMGQALARYVETTALPKADAAAKEAT
jgi:hypothetical protein